MNKNDVIRMAKASGLDRYVNDVYAEPFLSVALGFARLVAAAEREACVAICDERWGAAECSIAIRERGNKQCV